MAEIEPTIAAQVNQIRAQAYSKFVTSEEYLERNFGYKIIRKQVAAGKNSLIFKCEKNGLPDLHCIVKSYRGGKEGIRRLLREESVQIYRFVDSKCDKIINYHDVLHTNDHIYVMVDWTQNGDLLSALRQRQVKPDESMIRDWAHDLMSAISFLHSCAICHRNISPSILLLANDNHVKVSSLSDCAIYSTPDGKLIKQKWGRFDRANHWNQPPEVAKGKDYDPRRSDLWSVGATVFWMITRTYPIDYRSKSKLTTQLEHRLGHLSKMSHRCQDFLKRICAFQPSKRPTIAQSLELEWFQPGAPAPPNGEIAIPMDAPQVPGDTTGPSEESSPRSVSTRHTNTNNQ